MAPNIFINKPWIWLYRFNVHREILFGFKLWRVKIEFTLNYKKSLSQKPKQT